MDPKESLLRQTIPVVINSYNQLTYIRNLITALRQQGFRSIFVLDQASTYEPLLDYLNLLHNINILTLVQLPRNFGPHWFFTQGIFDLFPCPLIFSDPDIAIPDELDGQFCLRLLEATEKYKVPKAGCALDISTPEVFKKTAAVHNGITYGICEWEARHWTNPLEPNVFKADIDTTFHLFNKHYLMKERFYDGVRFAGPGFTAKHLPWYANLSVPPEEDAFYRATTQYSTWL